MADTIGEAYVELRPETSRFEGQARSSLTGAVTRVAGILAATFAATKVFDFGKQAVQDAAQVQKYSETVNQTFGASGKIIQDFASGSAVQLGISRQAALESGSAYGILFQNIGIGAKQGAAMTLNIEKLAGAMGQLKGQDPTQALDALRLSLAGNTRGLKQYGIVLTPAAEAQEALKLHIQGTSSAWTAAQKAQIIYGLATSHLSTLQREAAKHSGDLINVEHELGAEYTNLEEDIGAALLPAVAALGRYVLTGLIPALDRASKQIGSVLGPIIHTVTGFITRNRDALLEVVKAVGIAVGILGSLGLALSAVAIAAAVLTSPITLLVALGTAVVLAYRHISGFRSAVQGAFHAVAGVVGPVVSKIVEVVQYFELLRNSGIGFAQTLESTAIVALQLFGVRAQTSFAIVRDAVNVLSTVRSIAVSAFHALLAAAQPALAFIASHASFFKDMAIGLGIATLALFGVAAAMVVATAAGGALAAVMAVLASPVLLVVVAVGLLVGAFIYAYAHFRTFHDTVNAAVSGVLAVVRIGFRVIVQVIHTAVTLATMYWRVFGSTILANARAVWATIRGVISGALKIIQGVIQVFSGILTGNWTQVWNGVKNILSGAWQIILSLVRGSLQIMVNTIIGFAGAALSAAAAVGRAIWNGITSAIGGIVGRVRSILGGIPGAVLGVAGAALSAAVSIGKAIIQGIIGGVTGLLGTLASTVTSGITGALGHAGHILGITSPSRYTRDKIGVPIAQGIVQGALLGLGDLGPGMGRALTGALGGVGGRLQPAHAQGGGLPIPAAVSPAMAGVVVHGDLNVYPERFTASDLQEAVRRRRR